MARPALEVADIFRDHGPAWRAANAGHVSLGQLKVMSAIEPAARRRLAAMLRACENEACGHTPSPIIAAATGTAPSAMYGRRPPCKRNLTFLRCDRVRSCMRPIGAASLAAGHDVIRGSGPNQGGALFPRVALGGFSRSNGSTVSHPSFSPLQFETLHLHSSIPYFFIAEPFIF